jgi:hypothetical protein
VTALPSFRARSWRAISIGKRDRNRKEERKRVEELVVVEQQNNAVSKSRARVLIAVQTCDYSDVVLYVWEKDRERGATTEEIPRAPNKRVRAFRKRRESKAEFLGVAMAAVVAVKETAPRNR